MYNYIYYSIMYHMPLALGALETPNSDEAAFEISLKNT